MRGKGNPKGVKAVSEYGIEPLNEECRSCLYRKKGTCKGRLDALMPCLYATKIS